ncbi:MAG TPA: tRNA pseudouridine(55) synthase TruB [Saprospiraceae bacterium]|mgnify:CR=1 FL=1|nr:tRNA pseudouridine(55) synthase TruB [Saprospiraceae bacterium]HMQ84258.1 tRNA pseudouridine(55) synthase TruB [Saprospiraceae bacterium]
MNDDEDNPLSGYDFLNGAVLLVDKPQGWTSFDVVNKIRYKLKHYLHTSKIKVGHAGTLDPMATGLLIICTGKYTKKLAEFQQYPKEYTGTLVLGAATPSFDAETEIEETFPIDHITPELLDAARQRFIGDLDQVPPIFSAIKVDGQPLYKKARKGERVEIEPRKVHIAAFELTRVELPEVDFRVACSKGTYIRSLAHDFGQALDSGAYLSALRRTQVGPFSIQKAWDLEHLIDGLEALMPRAELQESKDS